MGELVLGGLFTFLEGCPQKGPETNAAAPVPPSPSIQSTASNVRVTNIANT